VYKEKRAHVRVAVGEGKATIKHGQLWRMKAQSGRQKGERLECDEMGEGTALRDLGVAIEMAPQLMM